MNYEIKEMFDEYCNGGVSRSYLLSDFYSSVGFGFIIYQRSYKDTILQNEKLENLKIFYDSLVENKDYKEARKKSGFNQRQAILYINFLNKEFRKRTNNIFFDREIRIRHKVENTHIVDDSKFYDSLENVEDILEEIKQKERERESKPYEFQKAK